MMSTALNATANEFIPGAVSHELRPTTQNEYEDAFLEYAYENGLWGIGGNHVPDENDIAEMRQLFAEESIMLNGYDDNIDYGTNIDDDILNNILNICSDEDYDNNDYLSKS